MNATTINLEAAVWNAQDHLQEVRDLIRELRDRERHAERALARAVERLDAFKATTGANR